MTSNLSIKIYGKVQGVFFRASTKEYADSLGLFGWVKNEADGTVTIEAEGEQEKLEEFCKWVEQGPRGSVVDRIDANYNKHLKHHQIFEIKY